MLDGRALSKWTSELREHEMDLNVCKSSMRIDDKGISLQVLLRIEKMAQSRMACAEELRHIDYIYQWTVMSKGI
jgi:hypothetical protein